MSATTARFIAIPVGQGDAFYLKTLSGGLLVDGGRAISGFADLFTRTTGEKGANIVICTHNDVDHANGVIGFLEAGLECREVWLPGRWLGVLPHALNPTPEVAEALIEQAQKGARELRGRPQQVRDVGTAFEVFGALLAQEPPRHGEETGFPAPNVRAADVTGGWPEDVVESLERAAWDERKLWSQAPYRCWPLCPWPRPICVVPDDRDACALFRGALDAAERIRRIAVAAYHRGVAVRWFDYEAASPQGGTRWLYPLNAREVAYVPRVATGQLVYFLALTTVNQESLVFWADLDDHPGVLFTADSDLKDVELLRNLSGAIITAPHHGSEANACAYSKVCAHLGESVSSITWVRSDGRSRSRPGPAYLSAPGRRVCTICRTRGLQPKQAVRLWMGKKNWARARTTKLCSCRSGGNP